MKLYYPFIGKRRGSAVGIATGYGLDDRGVGVPSPDRVKNSHLFKSSRSVLGSFPGAKSVRA
jgi:hypothetical protein